MSRIGNRSRNSLFNAISAVALTLVNGLLGIVVTRFIIDAFQSEFNGINSTANQITNMLLILEGGFTVASNVALFDPLGRGDTDAVNGLLSATRRKFRGIGLLFLLVGLAVSVGYALVADTTLPMEHVATIMVMTIVPAAFNLFYATTYRVLLQGQQKEYIINLFTMLTIGLGHAANIVMILCHGPWWMVRMNTLLFSFANSFLIVWYVKRKNRFLDLKVPPCGETIKGTNDVMVQKITGVVYTSAPIVFLSISKTGNDGMVGAAMASVYAVYNYVFTMLKSLLHGIIDAPRHSFGQMLTERKREEAWSVFAQYEYIAFLAVSVMLTTCCALILPFIQIYTAGLDDGVNYYNVGIAVLMVMIAAVEMVHVPSGHLITMSGHFRVGRNFQLIACGVLLVTMIGGGVIWGVYGMLGGLLATTALLAVLEMGWVHLVFFKRKLGALLRLLLPLLTVGVVTCFVEMQLVQRLSINGYIRFFLFGVVFVAVNGVLALLTAFIFNRPQMMSILARAKGLLNRR